MQPPIHEVSSLSSLNTSMQQLYDAIVAGKLSNEALASASNCWIDVRDVAVAHVLAAEKEAAGGERMIIAGGCYWWQDFGAFICFVPLLYMRSFYSHLSSSRSISYLSSFCFLLLRPLGKLTYINPLTVDAANAITPPILPNLPKGNPGGTKGKDYELSYDVSKAERILGIKYIGMEQMIKDCLEDFKKRGEA